MPFQAWGIRCIWGYCGTPRGGTETRERGTSGANVALIAVQAALGQCQGKHHMNSVYPYLIDSYAFCRVPAVLVSHSFPIFILIGQPSAACAPRPRP